MDFSYLQSRVSGAYIPPHRTQLHPRMHSFSAFPSPNQKPQHITSSQSREKWCAIAASFLIIPFLFYLFAIGRGVHQSSRFGESRPIGFGIVIDAGHTGSRIHVFEFLNQGRIPFVQFDGKGSKSMKVRPGLAEFAAENAGNSILKLLEFAKRNVPKTEWKNTRVWLMVREGVRSVGLDAVEVMLDSSRRVIASSGFLFRDEWASLLTDKDEGLYAWVAANYALGTLGGDPRETTGIVELGGASVQVTFVVRESPPIEVSRMVKLAGVTYNLYSQSLHQFGQDGAWESLHELYHSKFLTSSLNSSEGILLNPCIPKGYDQTLGPTITLDASAKKQLTSHSLGNFSACKSDVLSLLQNRKVADECLHPPCRIISSFLPELQGNPVSPENFFYTSEFFGLAPKASLSELEAAGHHYCENDWTKLKDEHYGVDEMDMLRYCFSSAYIVSLLHGNLGIPMDDKRVGFANNAGSMPLDWTLGAFILQTVVEPLESEDLGHVVGSDSLMYLSLFVILLLAFFAAFYVSKLWKPQLKTIYDLEKGHYIVTRVPR